MNTAVQQVTVGHVLTDYLTLLKLRIATFVGLAAFVGGLLGADRGVSVLRIAEAAVWIMLSAGMRVGWRPASSSTPPATI